MIDQYVEATLRQAVADGAFGLEIADEGRDYTPTLNVPYLQLWMLPVSSDQSLQTVDKDVGIYQIDLNYPRNRGAGDIRAMARTIASFFQPHAFFSHAGQGVTIKNRQPSRIRDAGGWQILTLSIVFRSAVLRDVIEVNAPPDDDGPVSADSTTHTADQTSWTADSA